MKKQASPDYDQFIAAKSRRTSPAGFEPMDLTAPLFDWQAHVVRWAVRQGRAALFEDCGLGKTAQQLEWSQQVKLKTSGQVLILTPLSVAKQTEAEAVKFGIRAKVVESAAECIGTGIFITNYEKLDKFDGIDFAGVVLDDHADEKHICPLQLDVIERAVMLWTNSGDLVYSPFAGIGSEGYKSIQLGRRFIGSELKESYFKQACENLSTANLQPELILS